MKTWLCILAFCAWTVLLAQQDMGVVTGIVTDATAAAVPEARVTATNLDTNERRSVVTSEAGSYTIGPLRIGRYSVEVEREGFKRAIFPEIRLSAQDRARADFQLELGQVTEVLAVTAEIPVLQAETSNLAHVVTQKEMRELPLNGRNFQQLAWMTAGVIPATRGRDRDSGFNAHGQPMIQNSFIVDGIDNNNNIMGMQDRKMQVVVPNLDAVAEFKVQTSNYSAEFGRNAGAVMIVSIKSGTNDLHGSLYNYLRNDRTDSRDVFSYVDRTGDGKADPEVLKQNQFGATLGGPIIRNRTFFFGGWEGRRERRAQSDIAIVPTADERQGIFDPRLVTLRDPATNQPFPNNRIPLNRFDSTAARMIELWPSPNFSGLGTRQNFVRNPPWNATNDQIDGRVDHNISDNDKIFGRISFNRFDNFRGSVFEPPARGGQGNDRALDDNDARSVAMSYTRIITPSLINEFRYGFLRQKVDKRELSQEPMAVVNERYGIRGVPAYDRLFGLPIFSLGGALGYQSLGEPGSMPNFKIMQVHQYLNNVSWNKGNHNLKFGADLRWNRSDIFGGAGSHGNFSFDGQFSRASFGDFLLGMPAQVSLTTLLSGQMRFRNYMFYALDDWKVTPKLTLNLGLRYELNTPWVEKHNNMSQIEIGDNATFNQINYAGHCGDSYLCRSFVDFQKKNLAPRVGFAYQVTPKTVIRSGAGIFFGSQGSLGANSRAIDNWPYNRSAVAQSTAARPAIQLSAGLPAGFLGAPTVPPANANWTLWEKGYKWPKVYQWNFAIQRELPWSFSWTTAYVGSSSNFVFGSYNWNGSPPGPLATEQQRRRIPQWNNISLGTPYGHASYHGMDVQLQRRYSAGLFVNVGYTWSHSIDNVPEQFGGGGGGLMDFRNFDLNRGNSNFDTRHRFILSTAYEIPIGRGKRWMNRGGIVNGIIGGWELSNMWSMQTGDYFTVTVPNTRARLGATGIGNWWPDRIRDPRLSERTSERWFDTGAFASPRNPDGTWRLGNAGRAILNSDGYFNIDMGLKKSFPITESMRFQVRWEVFNLTNTPTLGIPTTNSESPDFGKVRGTHSTPRQMQFALRLEF